MNWFTGTVLYILIWWVMLFAVLPFGTRGSDVPDPVTGWRGAPARPYLGRKVIATTLLAGVVWGGAYAVIKSPWISFRHGYFAAPPD